MRKLNVFNFITLNGFYKGPDEDLSWHKQEVSEEENEFSSNAAQGGATLVFGRVTYEMMVAWWPTPAAKETMPGVAKGMNESEKIVFSNTLKSSNWEHTRIISGDGVEEMKKLKQMPGSDMVILGSGSLITQFADAGLIDSYQLMLDPVAIGEGTPIFNGISHPLHLKLTKHQVFKSGILLLTYELA